MVFLLLYFVLGRAQNITGAEYFFNTDPGLGGGTAVALTGSDATQSYSIPLPSGMTGFNNLYMRSKNASNTWGFYNRVSFYAYAVPSQTGYKPISAAEYFIDTDPGFGSGTPLAASGTEVSQTYTAVLPTGLMGFHHLYMRAKNQDNSWAFYQRVTFYVGQIADLSIAALDGGEFFIDTDPGIGQGKQVTLTPAAGTDNYVMDLSTVNIPCGVHNFYLRVKNQNNTYSVYRLAKNVNVYDNAPPTILAKNLSLELDATGNASFTFADIDEGTKDDCSLATVTLSKTTFDCSNLGSNTVQITATDALGKVSTKDITITVLDKINPVAIAKNISLNLDANGTATITGAIINDGSTDNCSVTEMTVSKSQFDCSNLGSNEVTLTVKDAAGNTSTAVATVNVSDITAPVAIAKDISITIPFDSSSITIQAEDVNNVSTDNCSIASYLISQDTFTAVGQFDVVLTVKDASGNESTATATVTVSKGLSVDDANNAGRKMLLYPNPTSDIINIKTDKEIKSIQILDLSGRLIKTLKGSKQISVKNLTKNTYLIVIETEDGSKVTQKFIKKD